MQLWILPLGPKEVRSPHQCTQTRVGYRWHARVHILTCDSVPVPAPHHPQYTGPPKRGRPKNPPRPAAPPTPRQIRPAPDMASYPGSPALTPPPALPVPPRTPTPAINITPVSRVASRDASRAPSPPPFFHGPTNLPPQPYQGSSLMPTGPQGPSGIPRGELGRVCLKLGFYNLLHLANRFLLSSFEE